MTKRRWEQGSEFYWPPTPQYHSEIGLVTGEPGAVPWSCESTFWMTGRAALRAILGELSDARRVWVPSYFCQEVLSDILHLGMAVEVYADSPTEPMAGPDEDSVRSSDAVLVSNTFGLRVHSWTAPAGVVVIEDHTHDPLSPWALSSQADWCFASLRKWFPVPAGAAAWSPKGHAMPGGPYHESEESAAALKLASMVVKGLYLAGGEVEKRHYRQLSGRLERRLGEARGTAPAWLVDLLRTFPVHQWRSTRCANFHVVEQELAAVCGVEVLRPEDHAVAFSAVLALKGQAERDSLREHLCRAQIYPAILWNLEVPSVDRIPQRDVEFSRRMLSIHCDMRYGADDMLHVAKAITSWATGQED